MEDKKYIEKYFNLVNEIFFEVGRFSNSFKNSRIDLNYSSFGDFDYFSKKVLDVKINVQFPPQNYRLTIEGKRSGEDFFGGERISYGVYFPKGDNTSDKFRNYLVDNVGGLEDFLV